MVKKGAKYLVEMGGDTFSGERFGVAFRAGKGIAEEGTAGFYMLKNAGYKMTPADDSATIAVEPTVDDAEAAIASAVARVKGGKAKNQVRQAAPEPEATPEPEPETVEDSEPFPPEE
jgi:hypothetical protein